LKGQANLDLGGGGLRCEWRAGGESDPTSNVAFDCAKGELRVRDLGYFGVNHFEPIQHQGADFLSPSRVPADHVFSEPQGQKLALRQYVHDGVDTTG
jgi:hypothetical protein